VRTSNYRDIWHTETANALRRTVHIECGEGVAIQRGGEARDAASSGAGRIRNGHAHGLNDPRARLHGDEGLMLVVKALAQIVLLTEHRAVALVRNDTEPFRPARAVAAKFVQRDGEESVASSLAWRLVAWAPGIAQSVMSERNRVTKRTGTGIAFGYSGERSSSDLEGMCVCLKNTRLPKAAESGWAPRPVCLYGFPTGCRARDPALYHSLANNGARSNGKTSASHFYLSGQLGKPPPCPQTASSTRAQPTPFVHGLCFRIFEMSDEDDWVLAGSWV
jgi:hypothetical protein